VTIRALEETQVAGVYTLGFFRHPRPKHRRNPGDTRGPLAVYTEIAGTLDQFEALARTVLAEIEAIRAAPQEEPPTEERGPQPGPFTAEWDSAPATENEE
jgi:hypothetical protein